MISSFAAHPAPVPFDRVLPRLEPHETGVPRCSRHLSDKQLAKASDWDEAITREVGTAVATKQADEHRSPLSTSP
ncbi:MAG: hypothetical protein WKF73_18865 [Nocardioidaceae bacterium]